MRIKSKSSAFYFFVILLFFTLLNGNVSTSNKINSTIPEKYNQDIDLNHNYIYNVSDFGGPASWYNFTPWPADSFEGNFRTNPLGQIRVNFTGFHNKDVNDWGNVFENPIPWLTFELLEYDLGLLKTNFTLTNRSNSEVAYNLILGFNQFQPGFLIPNNNISHIKHLAQNQASGFFSGEVETEESYHFLFIRYEQSGGTQKTYLKYDKWTGLLVWAKTSVGNFRLEINSNNFTLGENQTYDYVVDDFGGAASWYNFTPWPADSFEGNFRTNTFGLIRINFTGLYNKDQNDWGNIFADPIPWLNIEIFENFSGILYSNFSLYNRSNSEVAYNLIIGYNNFQPGFMIPIMNNITGIKLLAFQESSGFASGNVQIQESDLTLKIEFEQIDGAQKSYMIYEKHTGLLLWANTTIGSYNLEIRIKGYEPWQEVIPKPSENNFLIQLIPYILVISISGILVIMSFIASKISPKYKNINKYAIIAIVGLACFSSLFLYMSSLSEGTSDGKTQEVSNISLIVDYGNGTIITVNNINLVDYKTTAFDALNHSCVVTYEDYGDMGYLVESINGTNGNWLFYVNDEYIVTAANQYYLNNGDTVKWVLS